MKVIPHVVTRVLSSRLSSKVLSWVVDAVHESFAQLNSKIDLHNANSHALVSYKFYQALIAFLSASSPTVLHLGFES